MVAVVLGAVLGTPRLASAQTLERALRVTNDNDYFNFWLRSTRRPDHDYTQGLRVSWDVGRRWELARRFACAEGELCASSLELGQEMYTPNHDSVDPLPGERPYAGWLYARGDVRGGNARQLKTIGLTAGITGPASLAQQVQQRYHSLDKKKRQPLGWDHQMQTELAFAARAGQRWHLAPQGAAATLVDLVPSVDASLGTLRTAMLAGARARVGVNLPHPWLSAGSGSPLSLYGFIGAGSDFVARDLFLDGSTFRQSERVDHAWVVPQWERGAGVAKGKLAVEYRAVSVGREYTNGPRKHSWGSVKVLLGAR
ncbi:MAG: lipid A deacylase LpxR family protein [Gemmatimonadaceae bacterium]